MNNMVKMGNNLKPTWLAMLSVCFPNMIKKGFHATWGMMRFFLFFLLICYFYLVEWVIDILYSKLISKNSCTFQCVKSNVNGRWGKLNVLLKDLCFVLGMFCQTFFSNLLKNFPYCPRFPVMVLKSFVTTFTEC